MLWLVVSLVLGPFFGPGFATPAPAPLGRPVEPLPLVTIESARGVGDAHHWQVRVVIEADGAWRAGPRSGRLDPDALATLRRALDTLPGEPAPRPMCRARPFAHQRLTTSTGTFVESTPCGARWPAAVAVVAAHVDGLTSE